MPQPFSVSISSPIIALPAQPAAPGASPAPDGPALPQSAAGPTDFLGQLKTALKNLTKVVKQPNLAAEQAPQSAAAQAPADDQEKGESIQ